jgi:hypothetical protein
MTLRTTLPWLLLLLLALAACSPDKGEAVGRYAAAADDTEIVLTLNDNGRGTWSTDMDEIPFKWSLPKPGQLWLHTREGGVVQGRIKDGRVTIALPGVEELVFERR